MNDSADATAQCCAECGNDGGVSLKACKSCMIVKYCNPTCQRNHWATHKKECKQRAAELRDEALFKYPPAKEDCPICFLPMPVKMLCCVSLPPATISSVPIYDYVIANEELADLDMDTEGYNPCCGNSICRGCIHSFIESGNIDQCPYCKAERRLKTYEEMFEEIMERVEANDPISICLLANSYHHGVNGYQQDQARAIELYARAAVLGCSKAHSSLGDIYADDVGDLKKAKFHFEAAAMAGHELARYNLGCTDYTSGHKDRAFKHWKIAASAGYYHSMYVLITLVKQGVVSRDVIESTLTSYNNSCAEMRSEARNAAIRID